MHTTCNFCSRGIAVVGICLVLAQTRLRVYGKFGEMIGNDEFVRKVYAWM